MVANFGTFRQRSSHCRGCLVRILQTDRSSSLFRPRSNQARKSVHHDSSSAILAPNILKIYRAVSQFRSKSIDLFHEALLPSLDSSARIPVQPLRNFTACPASACETQLSNLLHATSEQSSSLRETHSPHDVAVNKAGFAYSICDRLRHVNPRVTSMRAENNTLLARWKGGAML